MKNGIKKIVSAALAGLMCLGGAALASCGNSNEKNITVVVDRHHRRLLDL